MKHQFWALPRPRAHFLEPLVHGWGSLHPRSISELGAGRDMNVPESRGLSWSLSACTVSSIQATLVVTPVPGAVTADQPGANFSDYPRPAQFHGPHGPQWAGRRVQCRFYWGQTHPAFRVGCARQSIRDEGRDVWLGSREEWGFPRHEQSKKRVSWWWTCSLQPWSRSRSLTGTRLGQTTNPRRTQGAEEAEQGTERRPQEAHSASDRLAGGPGWLSGPQCLVWSLGVRQTGRPGVKYQLCATSENLVSDSHFPHLWLGSVGRAWLRSRGVVLGRAGQDQLPPPFWWLLSPPWMWPD